MTSISKHIPGHRADVLSSVDELSRKSGTHGHSTNFNGFKGTQKKRYDKAKKRGGMI